MSHASIAWLCLFFVAFAPAAATRLSRPVADANGGTDCAVCSIVLGLVDKLTIVYNTSAVNALEKLCSVLPGQYKVYCKVAVEFLGEFGSNVETQVEIRRLCLGPYIVDAFVKGDNPDVICHSLKLCHDTAGQPKCRIYPTAPGVSVPERAEQLRQRHPLMSLFLLEAKICDFPGIKEICKILNNVFNNHIPLVDLDHDKFGVETTLRGSSWRGKDCNDASTAVHPGAQVVQGDATADHNCNGILGMNSATGNPWESELCDDSRRMGLAVLGDSISAHFHIPEQWLDAREFSPAAFEHLAFILENELDWPQMSASTGHVNVSWPNIEGNAHCSLNECHLRHTDGCVRRTYPIALQSSVRSRPLQPSRLSKHRRQRRSKWRDARHHEVPVP